MFNQTGNSSAAVVFSTQAGQYYLIKSQLNGQCLDVSKAGGDGSKVIVFKKHGKPNQLWYDHDATGTIRSKCNDLCLEIKGHLLLVKAFESGNPNQQWQRHDKLIRNRLNHNQVIEILNSTTGDVGENNLNNEKNQLWDFEYVPSAGPAPQTVFKRSDEYYIVSEKNGKVLDIIDAPKKDKKSVIPTLVVHNKQYPPPKSQLWYTDELSGFIHSALNDAVFVDLGAVNLVMATYKVHKDYQWKLDGKKIVNGAGLVLDIRGDTDKDGANLCAYKYNGQPNQHWLIIRV
ncbi:hypothetical protein HELRODRAFT_170099 [Helobdella robusta]|uniref:Ricin B lectin domain-containing protein n=1 Tax=Helobdella robusta TaxID=6412 RepID=T1F2M4_HELRO|nr:hypothetical protein HELRODRAFT_170099 [Helobdella robusta]ESO07555.1 hypothetical protein HELRODRAFT_170099 [Helobdella robusta]